MAVCQIYILEILNWSKMWKILSLFWLKNCCFLQVRNAQVSFAKNQQIKINSLKKQNHGYLIHTWPDLALKGTVVNRAVPSLHLRVTWNYACTFPWRKTETRCLFQNTKRKRAWRRFKNNRKFSIGRNGTSQPALKVS